MANDNRLGYNKEKNRYKAMFFAGLLVLGYHITKGIKIHLNSDLPKNELNNSITTEKDDKDVIVSMQKYNLEGGSIAYGLPEGYLPHSLNAEGIGLIGIDNKTIEGVTLYSLPTHSPEGYITSFDNCVGVKREYKNLFDKAEQYLRILENGGELTPKQTQDLALVEALIAEYISHVSGRGR